MNNPNLYIPPSNKVPAWIGWILGVGFVGIILASGTVVIKHVSPAQAAGSLDAVAEPAAAPVAAAAVAADSKDEAPAVAAAPAADNSAPVAAAPRTKAKFKTGKAQRFAKLGKGKPAKPGARHYTQERSAKILAKHDTNSTRQSKQKLDRLLGL